MDKVEKSKNFNFGLVSGTRQAEIFANAVEESANSERKPFLVKVTEIRGWDEIQKFLAKGKTYRKTE